MKLIIQTDGGSRGNPGPAAGGFLLSDPDGTRRAAKAFFLGRTTNNVAEYTALVKALEAAAEMGGHGSHGLQRQRADGPAAQRSVQGQERRYPSAV